MFFHLICQAGLAVGRGVCQFPMTAAHYGMKAAIVFARHVLPLRRVSRAACAQLPPGLEPLEMRRVFAADVSFSGGELTISFDDLSNDELTLEINATGFSTSGANVSSGVGAITGLTVTDAGQSFPSNLTLLQADQVLTNGVRVDGNVTSVAIRAPLLDAGTGLVRISSSELTLHGDITAGSQAFESAIMLAGDVSLATSVASSGAPTVVDRLVVVAQPLAYGTDQLTSDNPATLYRFPSVYGNINTITSPIVPSAVPLATVPGLPTIGFTGVGGSGGTLSFTGDAAEVATGIAFEEAADAYFQANVPVPPGRVSTTEFAPSASGALEAPVGTWSAFAYYDYIVSGTMSFGGSVNGPYELTIDTSDVVIFNASIGESVPLRGLRIASAASVTTLGTVAIDGQGGASNGLEISDGVNNVNISQPGSTITNAALSGLLLGGNSTGSVFGGFTITDSGRHGVEAAGGNYTGTVIENSAITGSGGDGFRVANGTGLTGSLLSTADNAGAGVRVAGTSANVTISDSLVGLTANGGAARPNLGQGVIISAGTGTTLQNNTISGNTFYGVVVAGAADSTVITGNRIGLGSDGTTAIGNGQSGVFVLEGASGTTIVGNQIGYNNGMAGIQVVDGASNTTIGGSGGSANLLVNNGQFGVTVSGDVTGSRVLGNLISGHTTANLYLNNAQNLAVGSSTAGEANTFDTSDYGVYAGGNLAGTTIEGNTFQDHSLGGLVLTEAEQLTIIANTIEDNGAYGIYGTGNLTGTTVQGNTISNHTVGVLVDNGNNLTIGSANGTVANDTLGNTISKNSSAGIVVNDNLSSDITMLSNRIFENDFIGISLSAGGNARAVTPTLASANTTLVTGSISGTDGDVFRIQYFKSSANVTTSSRFAQGEELIAWQDVTIAGGTASIDEDISGAGVIVTDWITATATLLDGGLPAETSQFSFGIRVTA